MNNPSHSAPSRPSQKHPEGFTKPDPKTRIHTSTSQPITPPIHPPSILRPSSVQKMKLSAFSALALATQVCHAADANAWKSRSIYFALTDRVARHGGDTGGGACSNLGNYCGGTFQGLQGKLEYIKDMGFDALWITPVVSSRFLPSLICFCCFCYPSIFSIGFYWFFLVYSPSFYVSLLSFIFFLVLFLFSLSSMLCPP